MLHHGRCLTAIILQASDITTGLEGKTSSVIGWGLTRNRGSRPNLQLEETGEYTEDDDDIAPYRASPLDGFFDDYTGYDYPQEEVSYEQIKGMGALNYQGC